jgi:hypothetical protein
MIGRSYSFTVHAWAALDAPAMGKSGIESKLPAVFWEQPIAWGRSQRCGLLQPRDTRNTGPHDAEKACILKVLRRGTVPGFRAIRELLKDSTPASQIQFPLRFDEFLDRKFDLFAGVGS